MALVELSFPIKRQELSNKLRIKDDSRIALRKKRRSGTHIVYFVQLTKNQEERTLLLDQPIPIFLTRTTILM